ncbi:MAG: GNAT family N-acetyltransferase [Phycisphaerales bacterium]|nr:MAG: GNAT family N-acetyltransferase [Phycisphaerales bacterium]
MSPRRRAEQIGEVPHWLARFSHMVVSPEEAIGRIRPGHRVFLGSACGQPQALVRALLNRARELDDLEIIHLVTLGEPAALHTELAERFRLRPFFIEGGAENSTHGCVGDHTPVLLSDIPGLFMSGRVPIDVALVQVTEPDEDDRCSLGVSVDVTRSAMENAGLVIAQVNRQMPRTLGDSFVPVYDLDVLVAHDEPLLEINLPTPSETERSLASNAAALIPDGSTVGFGTDGVSMALPEFLQQKRDLGVHAEVISNAIMELVDTGAVTGVRKTNDRGKVVGSMCLGTRKLYDCVDHNPLFCFRPSEQVSDPMTISRQRDMVTVSRAAEMDLMGQIAANSSQAGSADMGGHANYVHGVTRADGGRMIVVLESIAADGTVSRIVPHLSRGARVVATCFEVHYVVTEYGVAYLRGKSLQERALALISIAHPQFRGQLLRQAVEHNYVSSDLIGIEGRIHIEPPALKRSMVLDNGSLVTFRPLHLTDEARMQELFQSLSRQTIYYRFMAQIPRVPRRQIQNFVYIDYRDEMAIVGTVPEAQGEEIVAVGRYYLIPGDNRAEVAFVVRDEWQGHGIGSFLLSCLAGVARAQGLAGFSAEVLAENKAMLAVLQKSGFAVRRRLEGSTCSVELDF